MARNTREYNRRYGRLRTFLYRLAHPPKTRGVKPGHRFLNRAKVQTGAR
jgi:hypothetical protein